jgi:hypothetical protein
MEAVVFYHPRGNTVMFVGAVIVDNHVEVDSAGGLPVELAAQKLEILLMAVARRALTDDRSIENIECGKQRGCAVALVIVSYNLTSGASSPVSSDKIILLRNKWLTNALTKNRSHRNGLGRLPNGDPR